MANQHHIPENDKDLLLARSLGVVLDKRESFTLLSDDDSLVNQLLSYKEHELTLLQHIRIDSETIWNNITKLTQKSVPAHIIPFYQRTAFMAWSTAAVLMIVAFVGFYMWFMTPQLTLIAETGNEKETITLADGSIVTLRAHSKLFEVAGNDMERTYKMDGEAFFDVSHDPSRPFSVSSDDGTVTVLGTRFDVSNWGNKTSVYLEEGKISFTSKKQQKPVILAPGQSAEVRAGTLSVFEAKHEEQFTDWMSNTIVLDGSTPESVIAEIEHQYHITISIETLTAGKDNLSGVLQLGSLNLLLDDLGTVYGGTFRKVDDSEFIFVPMN